MMDFNRGGSSSEFNAQGYRTMKFVAGGNLASNKKPTKRKAEELRDSDDEYFNDGLEEVPQEDDIIAACPFLSEEEKKEIKSKSKADEELDPLDAFMAGIENEMATQTTEPAAPVTSKKRPKDVRDDLEQLDSEELYYKYMEENPNAGRLFLDEEGNPYEFDEEGNPVEVKGPNRKVIEPLPVIYHSEIDYPDFKKDFYREHPAITQLTDVEVNALRGKLNIRVSGYTPPKPVSSFAHFGFDDKLMSAIRKQEYIQPTPIQAQGIPCASLGRDVIGIAKTGSGKTAAFVWPLLVHIVNQPVVKENEGPIGLIVAPTRELCQQIYLECRRFGKVFGLRSACCYGGGNMHDQQKALSDGCEIVVCTPGRIIDHVKKKNTSLHRVTYLVFDEADRMFDMGFEYQVRSIANHIRPDRQTLLFSATFRKRVERLARDILQNPVRIVQGDIGEANTDVTQVVEVLKYAEMKWNWLTSRIVAFTAEGSLLIFVTKKVNAEELATNLKNEGYDVALIHGDMNQFDRNTVITDFKKKQVATLVATDVAARGLDIPSIKNVVNFDVARDIDTHTHRIGRTGRAGQKGTAYTLVTSKDSQFAGDLVKNLEHAEQRVPEELMKLALQNPRFKKSRFKDGRSSNPVKERPGLGAPAASAVNKPGTNANTTAAFRQSQSGVLGGRASCMKEYFKNQYQSNFVQSSEPAASATWNSGESFKLPGTGRKKKSRWDS